MKSWAQPNLTWAVLKLTLAGVASSTSVLITIKNYFQFCCSELMLGRRNKHLALKQMTVTAIMTKVDQITRRSIHVAVVDDISKALINTPAVCWGISKIKNK